MGYFLNGLYISAPYNLHNIEHGRCCKPRNHPDGYGLCYTEDLGESFEREGWTSCSKLGYYITGVYRGSGNWLKNIDKFRCCQMATGMRQSLPEIMTRQCKVANFLSLDIAKGNGVFSLLYLRSRKP